MVIGRYRHALPNQHACSMMFEMLQACWLVKVAIATNDNTYATGINVMA